MPRHRPLAVEGTEYVNKRAHNLAPEYQDEQGRTLLPTRCWCEARTVMVLQHDVNEGLTLPCTACR